MSNNVYKVTHSRPRCNHAAIFVETRCTKESYLFSVKGNIHNGMTYYIEGPSKPPEDSETFASKRFIGIVSDIDKLRFAEVCEEIPPPKKQYSADGQKLYPDEPIRRSKEWVEETIQALRKYGVLQSPKTIVLD